MSPPNSAVECVPAHADAKVACSPNGVDACSEFSATIAHIAAIAPADALANPAVILHHRAPKLIASSANRLDKIGNASEDRRRGHSRGPRTASKIRLVANARPSWDCPGRRKTGSHRPPAGRLVADVIVLADRDGRDQGRAIAEVRAGITAPAQPGCRGPPAAGSHQLRACEPELTRGARGSRHRPRTDAATAPADPTVVDRSRRPRAGWRCRAGGGRGLSRRRSARFAHSGRRRSGRPDVLTVGAESLRTCFACFGS